MMFANVMRMMASVSKTAALEHPLRCETCRVNGMFDCDVMIGLLKIAVQADRAREQSPRCEWNPGKGEVAQIQFVGGAQELLVHQEGRCPNPARVTVGEKITFWLCPSCVELPKFFGRPYRHLTVEEMRGFTNPPAYTGL